jgi:hypothetical protein
MLGADHFFSMNSFEPLFWMGCAWLLIRIVRTGDARLWLWFGVVAGLGLENKYSMGLFGFALLAGLLLSGRYRSPCLALVLDAGGAIALLIFLPNLVWNIVHHFPFLELQQNIKRSGRDVALSPLRFLLQEQSAMLPLSLPIWLAGLWFFFFSAGGRAYRFLGWAWIITAASSCSQPAHLLSLSGLPGCLRRRRSALGATASASPVRHPQRSVGHAMILMGAALAPIVIPMLSPEDYIQYAKATHQEQPRIENHKLGPLPQLFADQFGWPEMAATVASVYNSLPADVRPRTAIFAQSYGQAGAIDYLRTRLGLPAAISGHQSLYLVGSARLHRREHDRARRPSRAARRDIHFSPLDGQGRPSLCHALQPRGCVLVPGIEGAPRRVLAAGEEVGLRHSERAREEGHSTAMGDTAEEALERVSDSKKEP